MTYGTPLRGRVYAHNTHTVEGKMPVYGTNFKDYSQLLDTRSALKIENLLIHGIAQMQKRPGQSVDFNTGANDVMTVDDEYIDDYDVVADGTKARIYNNATKTFTIVKGDFSANNGGFTGGRYGDYFFVNNALDGLWRIFRTISWNELYNFSGENTFNINRNSGTSISIGQTLTDPTTGHTAVVVNLTEPTATTMVLTVNTVSGAFTLNGSVTGGTLAGGTLTSVNPFIVGTIVTGTTSGATGVVLEVTDNGATGSLVLGSVKGTFQNGETLTSSTGRGLATSLLTFSISQVTGAPKAAIFRLIGNRAILIRLEKNKAGYNYSATDLGGVPFTNWTVGTGYNDPGEGSYGNGGSANDCAYIGDQIFIGQDSGWYAFKISQTTLTDNTGANVSAKYDQPIAWREDFPVYRCVMTNAGMIVASSAGIFRLVSLGQPNIAFSDQWENLTDDLAENYFTDVNFSTTDIMYDIFREFIYVTIGKDSQINNLILAVKVNSKSKSTVKTGATSFFTGWNIRNFFTRGSKIYGSSAIKGIRYNLLVGQKDVNRKIHTEYLQELNYGFSGAFKMMEFYAHGELSPISKIIVSFDTFNEKGRYKPRRKKYEWKPRNFYFKAPPGWGEAAFGKDGWSGGASVSGLIPDFTGAKPKLRQLTRVYLRFESDDFGEHIINWFTANADITKQVRNRSLTEITS